MAIDVTTQKHSTDEQINYKSKNSSKPVMTISKDVKSCPMCEQNHHLYQCQKFRDSDNNSRWSFVKTNRLCFCCMQPGHGIQKCNKREKCNKCNKFHNRLLHKPNEDVSVNTAPTHTAVATVSAGKAVQQESTQQSNWKSQRQTLLKYLPVKLRGPKGEINVIAFIDEGAKISLLENSVANAIGLKGKSDLLQLKWIGNRTASEHSRQVSFEIAGEFKAAEFHHMRGVRTTKIVFAAANVEAW